MKMEELLKIYDESWDKETKIFLNHLNFKKEETEKISSLEKEIEIKQSHAKNLPEQLQKNDNDEKLLAIYDALKAREDLYETYFKCNISYESPNVYKFSFLKSDSSVAGWIRFEQDEVKNKWIVLDFRPENVIPETIINKFHESQDTQGLLCYLRARI